MFRRLFGHGQDAPRTEEEAQQEEQKIDQATAKARQGFFGQISSLFTVDDPITDEFWDDLEALLIQADVGVETSTYLVNRTKDRTIRHGVKRIREAKDMLKAEMVRTLQERAAGGRRYLSRRRHRAARNLGRARRRAGDHARPRRRPWRGGVRRSRGRAGARCRRADRRYSRAPARQSQPDARARKAAQYHSPPHP